MAPSTIRSRASCRAAAQAHPGACAGLEHIGVALQVQRGVAGSGAFADQRAHRGGRADPGEARGMGDAVQLHRACNCRGPPRRRSAAALQRAERERSPRSVRSPGSASRVAPWLRNDGDRRAPVAAAVVTVAPPAGAAIAPSTSRTVRRRARPRDRPGARSRGGRRCGERRLSSAIEALCSANAAPLVATTRKRPSLARLEALARTRRRWPSPVIRRCRGRRSSACVAAHAGRLRPAA